MIAKLESVVSWIRTAIVAASSVGALQAVHYFSPSNDPKASSVWIWIAAIIVVMLATKGVEALSWIAINNSAYLRKIILGRQFVEGYWVDRLVDTETKEIISIGIVEISYQDGSLFVNGYGYSRSYDPRGSFKTYVSKYESLTLKYGYESTLPFSSDVKVHGHGQYNFVSGNPYPTRFTGYMQDSHFKNKILLEGQKISDKSVLENIDDDDVRADIVSEFARRNGS